MELKLAMSRLGKTSRDTSARAVASLGNARRGLAWPSSAVQGYHDLASPAGACPVGAWLCQSRRFKVSVSVAHHGCVTRGKARRRTTRPGAARFPVSQAWHRKPAPDKSRLVAAARSNAGLRKARFQFSRPVPAKPDWARLGPAALRKVSNFHRSASRRVVRRGQSSLDPARLSNARFQ